MMPYFIMYGGAIFKHLEKDKFLVTNAGDGKDLDNVVVKLTLKDLKDVLSAYGVDTKRKKKQELLDDFIKISKNMTVDPKPESPKKSRAKKVMAEPKAKKEPVNFEPMEEMMDFAPTPKNIQIKKPVKADMERVKALEAAASPARLSRLLPIRSEREDDLLEFGDDELKEIIEDQEIKFKGGDKRDRIDAILKHEGITKGASLPETKYNELETMHNVLNLKVKSGERGLAVMYRALDKFKEELNKMRKTPDRDTSAELFQEQKINQYIEKIKDVEDLFLKDGFNKKTKAAAKVAPKAAPKAKAKKESVKFEPMEEMMDFAPTPKNIQIKKPEPKPRIELLRDGKYPHEFTSDLVRMEVLKADKSFDEPIVNIDREYALFEMKKPELVKIAKTYKIKSTLKVNDMIDAILEAEKLPRVVKPTGDKGVDAYSYMKLQTKNKALTAERESNIYDDIVNKMLRYYKDIRNNDLNSLGERSARRRDIRDDIDNALKRRRERLTGGKMKRKGGSISAKDLKGLHASSYKQDPDKEVNGWVLDEDISKPTARVYFNASKNQAIVVHRGTEATVKDWANNLAYLTGTNKLTGRYKDAERVQKRAEEKYADVLTTGHSQGGIYTKIAKDQSKVININPASMGETTSGTTIRAKNDPVSALAGFTGLFKKNDKNITTQSKGSLLDAHSIDILDELGDKELGGSLTKYLKGLKKGGDFKSFFEKTLPRALVKQGIPILGAVAGTALGSIAGPISGAVGSEVGSKAGEVLSKYVSDKAGYGMKGGYLGQNPFTSFGAGTRRLQALGR